MQTLTYPDYWPLTNYSPPVADVRMAYAEGAIDDKQFDEDIVWAMDYPEPPADVCISGEVCYIRLEDTDTIPEPLADLRDTDSSSVEIDYETTTLDLSPGEYWTKMYDLIVGCHPDELGLVFDALTEDGPEVEQGGRR